MLRRVAEWVWYGSGAPAESVRLLLGPLSAAYGAAVRHRNRTFDSAPGEAVLPAMSIGNLTVGGTGKTPVSSWFTARLIARGAYPAIVLRGYGDDEWRVHRLLTPRTSVVMNADRRAAMIEARSEGADCAVLDDAFQHRRAARVSDIVLVSVDRFQRSVRLLPAGPFREGMSALRRATAVILTIKAADDRTVMLAEQAVREAAPDVPVAVVRLTPDRVCRVPASFDQPMSVSENEPESHGIAWLAGRRLLVTSAIADADAFERQVVAHGVQLVRHLRFPDHHDFSDADIGQVIAAAHDADAVLCTLKDAVKLAPRWPREAAPLWYVSQTLVVERGAEVLDRECDRVLAARDATKPTVG